MDAPRPKAIAPSAMLTHRILLWLVLLASLVVAAGSGCSSSESTGVGGHGGQGGTTAQCTTEGEARACYPGSESTRNLGVCHDGSQRCEAGSWTACTGAVVPTDESCGNGLDDDCNGVADEGCACETGDSRACYGGSPSVRGIGICVDGTQACVAETWASDCVGDVLPTTEDDCNGLDDDCDGTVEADPQSPECCARGCETKICGAPDACGGTCGPGTGCCAPACSGKLCGAADGCGGNCVQGSGCCTPSCAGKDCGESDGCTGDCDGDCPWKYYCDGDHECACGPSPHYQVVGSNCLPSCGSLLGHLGLQNDGGGCCASGCSGTQAGGPGATHDCNYCCESVQGVYGCS